MQVHEFVHPSEPGETHWRLLCSDLHLETPECDRPALLADLKAARKVNARILVNGDAFDNIWPGDKRFTPSVLRKSLQGKDDLAEAIVEDARQVLSPFADLIDVIGNGNHERSIHRRRCVDPIGMLIKALNWDLERQGSAHRIRHGGVCGYILTRFRFPQKPGWSTSGLAHKLLYFHGSGGESPVTKGLININRIAANFDYDLMTFGHKHNRVFVDDTFLYVTKSGRVAHRQRISCLTGSYVRSYRKGDQRNPIHYNYAEDFISIPKPIGGLFVSLTPERAKLPSKGEGDPAGNGWRIYQQVHTRPVMARTVEAV